MAEPTDNELPVDQLAAESLATEAAKAWHNIAELTRAYREANDKFLPAKLEYTQALKDKSEGGASRRFRAKNALKDVVNQESSAYAALLAGKKRFNDIQARRIAVTKSVVAPGVGQQNAGDDGTDGSVAGGAANAGRLIYSWLRRTTTGFFTTGSYVMRGFRKNLSGVNGRTVRTGVNDLMSAAFGSRNAIWNSKMFGRISGLLSGSPMGMVGAAIGTVADIINNQAEKGKRATENLQFYEHNAIASGMTRDEIKQAKDIGNKYGIKEDSGGTEWLNWVMQLKSRLNQISINGQGMEMFNDMSEALRGKLDIFHLTGMDAAKNLQPIIEGIMDALSREDDPAARARALQIAGARGAAAQILTRGRMNYETDKIDVGLGERVDLSDKARDKALEVRAQTAREGRASEADDFRRYEMKADTVIVQSKAMQIVHETDAIGTGEKIAGWFGWMFSKIAQNNSNSITGVQTVIPSTIPAEAEKKAAAGVGNVDKSVKTTFNGNITVQTSASNLEGATEAAVAAGMAKASESNAKK